MRVYLGLPGKPGTPTFTDVMDTSLVLRWTAPEDNGGAEITSYVIQCRTENEVDWRPATGDKVAKTEHALTQLKTNVVYQFKVAAVNKVGTGPFSEPSEPVRVKEVVGSFPRFSSGHNHRSVLNILDSLLASQIPAKGVVTIVCRIEIRKMAEC